MKKLNKATVLIIASMLVLALTLVATFSWFPRVFGYDDSKSYNNLKLNPTQVFIKATPANVITYKCNMVDGLIDEAGKTELSGTPSVEIEAGECVYFKTIVSYTENVPNSNFSLTGLELNGTTGDIKVCSLYPMKTIKPYSAGMSVAEHIAVTSANNAVVEWYLYNSSKSTPHTLTITALPTASVNG